MPNVGRMHAVGFHEALEHAPEAREALERTPGNSVGPSSARSTSGSCGV
jgi:hypothetical protein